MHRSALVLVALSTFTLVAPRLSAAASTPITGTIECSAEGMLRFSSPYLPFEQAAPNTKPLRAKLTNDASSCDGSGVVGAPVGIGSVQVKVQGTMAAETSCGDFLDTISYDAKVRLRWRGTRFVGMSKTTVASVTWDAGTESVVLVTDPIAKGPFTGSTVTMRFAFPGSDQYAELCTTAVNRYTGFVFGDDYGGWSISVP